MNAGKNDKFNCSSYFISHYADCMYSWGSILGKKQGNQVIGPSNSVFTIHWVSESQSAQRDV